MWSQVSLVRPDRLIGPRTKGALINGLVYPAAHICVKLRESGKTNQIALFLIIA